MKCQATKALGKRKETIQYRKYQMKYNMKVGITETKHIKQIKRPHIRIYIMRLRHEHKPNDQKVNRHTDGKVLSVAPNTTRTITGNILNSFMCG